MTESLGPYELGRVHHADCLDALRRLPDGCVDAILTDPPYALTAASRKGSPRVNDPETPFGRTRLGSDRGFMGKTWDGALPPVELWAEALRVAKPGAHLLAFGGTRTFHRLACAIEDAGWEIRDCLSWLYGQGFPKSLDVSKAIDREAGEVRQRVPGGQGGRNTILGARKTRELICVSCGWHWLGTETELSAARAAEAAWHARTDGERGPWSNVLKRHARRHRAQVLLFRAGGER